METQNTPHESPQDSPPWTARVITLFPEAFPGALDLSLSGKALKNNLWRLETIALRDYGVGKHRDVDAPPAGGGAGLVMRADVLGPALDHAAINTPTDRAKWPIVYLSPRGKRFTQTDAQRFSQTEGITLLCGRFEGIDERIIQEYAIEEVSIGDFILFGGEIAAQVLIDATIRLIPRIIGNEESIQEESFSSGLLEYPHYTRPFDWKGREIPEVLLSGHHGRVRQWRDEQAKTLTHRRRPDLWQLYQMNKNKAPDE